MQFAWTGVLWLLPLVIAGGIIGFIWLERGRRSRMEQFVSVNLLPKLLCVSEGRRKLKAGLWMLGLIFLILALARPQWGSRFVETRARGIDILFALDTSKSMLAEDYKPNRLERSKLAIVDLLSGLKGDRVGLVAFAGQAFLQCPLTADYDAFRQSLEALDTDIIPVPGTDVSAAIREALTAFSKDANHKILILITDGEDLEGQGVALAESVKDDLKIFTVGVGTEKGELIPLRRPDGSTDFLKDASGAFVKTKLDVQTLTSIADKTGGFFVNLGNGDGLHQVYESGLKGIPDQELSAQVKPEAIDRYLWFLAASALCFLECFIVKRPRKGL
ncbi:MAG: hypothetical protein A2Y14_05270 [Verrucomicrobia bacterium GWF2_51_19]|nr:MAG: hypothetical protein A2Y14_05270 [Verrucomicrobia bacterium GWF2_51_19]HCJ12339.1 hypothetical protein [Opitutae bacterium]